ncbi:MAG: hypothetical protein KC492_44550 [Myxococcales bacterium]|nr:hypothetical protein [Myxococcales bacterium]
MVEAEQFLGPEHPLPFSPREVCWNDGFNWYVTTIHEHRVPIREGDWIILEDDGDKAYPCRSGIFEATYEEVE